ncbi:MAG: hypothetical protein ACE5JT_01115 [Nitrosopumilaceae archaeon]
MSVIETIKDEENTLLSRREIICTFKGLGGKLKKLEAIDVVSKHFKLEGKVVIPIQLKNATGIPNISGTFYVYDDEVLAKEHLKPAIFSRLEKAKSPPQKKEEKVAETKAEKGKEKAEETKTDESPKEKSK